MKLINSENKTKHSNFQKLNGSHYTPPLLANFVAQKMVETADGIFPDSIKILDPAVGDGELLIALLKKLSSAAPAKVEAFGYDIDQKAVETGIHRINNLFPNIPNNITCENFVDISQKYDLDIDSPLFDTQKFDFVIANPPYVRTQNLGATESKKLSNTFELTGRIDLYQVFIRGIAAVLRIGGIAGIIVSNRFMTTKSGLETRKIIKKHFEIIHVWDLGDTRLFEMVKY